MSERAEVGPSPNGSANPSGIAVQSPPVLAGWRILVVHDWIMSWAGSERVVEQILRIFPQADFIVGVVSERLRSLNDATCKARETWLSRLPWSQTHHRWLVPLEGLAFATINTSAYDLVLSSTHAFAKMVRRPRGGIHVSYCHSPPRYLWDLQSVYRKAATGAQRAALSVGGSLLRWLDRRSAAGVDQFICNSAYVARRIRRIYGRGAQVVHPPVDPKPVARTGQRDSFLLYLGRLVPYKRVDLAIRAAERLGVPLIVAGDGPDRARLEQLGGRWTTFIGEVSEREAGDLLGRCGAFVFCGEEDFGIAPLEANAHGAPVVAYARGGLLETMISGVTAEFFEVQNVSAVSAALRRALARNWDEVMLRRNAERFAPTEFRKGFRNAVMAAVRAREC